MTVVFKYNIAKGGQSCYRCIFTTITVRVLYCAGESVYIGVHGAAENSPIRLSRGSIKMDATYMTMTSQKQLTIINRSDVVISFRWSSFATQLAEDQFGER